jgi:hypothetical protein
MAKNILSFPRSFAPPSLRISPRISLSAEEAAFHRARPGLRTDDPTRGSIAPIDPAQETTIQVRSAVAHIDREIANYTTRERLRRLFV